MPVEEYEEQLKEYRKHSDRHILVVETNMSLSDAQQLFAMSDRLRKAGNDLITVMQNRYHQLMRTKRYRKLLELYGKAKKGTSERAYYGQQLQEMQKLYGVTWEGCRKTMIPIVKKYNVLAVLGVTKAEDIWHGLEKCLYSDGKTIHFSKFGDYPCLRAKQISRAIPISVKNGELVGKIGKTKFGLFIKDKFQQDEINAILNYMKNPEKEDIYVVKHFWETGECVSTYRPCYATLVPKKIRGRYRVFLHLCIEGKPVPKFDKYGNPRHSYGKGQIGADIGTQTVAYTSQSSVGLKNLAERGKQSIKNSERMERFYLRKMDRSKRATNPQNYNVDGTIKKGRKVWRYSKNYKKTKYLHANLCRKNAENRRFANNEDANYLRSIGDVFVTEPKNAKKLMKRAKKTTVNEKTGKINKKKRFGKSIRNRCPGYFQTKVQQLFESTGGVYIEVPNDYRASQYDHTADDYIKKKLSDRMYNLTDGTKVQRDWYSSFLLYCYDFATQNIDKEKCNNEFRKLLDKEKALISWIKANKIKVLNSGIKFDKVA